MQDGLGKRAPCRLGVRNRGADGDAHRKMLTFRTLTLVPIERSLIVPEMLSPGERAWLNSYHALCRKVLTDRLTPESKAWLYGATAPV